MKREVVAPNKSPLRYVLKINCAFTVTPAQAGAQEIDPWIPACAEPAPVGTGE
jgi:hypothetical protein